MFINKKKFFFFSFFVVLYFFLIINNRETISSKKALSDFYYLIESIEENFPGNYHINITKKNKLERSREEITKKLLKKENVDIYYFYKYVDDYLCIYNSSNGPLGHLYLLRTEDLQSLKDIRNIIPSYAWDDTISKKTFDTYQYISKREKILNIEYLKNKEVDNNIEIVENNNHIIITIKSFDHRLKNKDFKKLQKFFKEKNSNKDVIIDISNCTGGSDYYWVDNFIIPNMYPKKEIFSSKKRALFLDGNLVQPYLDFFKKSSDYKVKEINESNLKNIGNLKNFKYLVEMTKGDTIINTKYKDKMLKSNIYVYYGYNTSSAAEDFIEFLKFNKMAKLCGTKSKGNSPFVQPVFLKLPNSNLVIRFQVDYRINENNEVMWENGIEPDIYVNNIYELEKFIEKERNE